MKVGSGEKTDFCGDRWFSDKPLLSIFPGLFQLCNEQKKTVKQMVDSDWTMMFRRRLNNEQNKSYKT